MTYLPVIDNNNVKRIVIEGLESKFAELGKLYVPVVITTDYPSSSANSINDSGETVPSRKISVKRLSSVPSSYAIGDVYASELLMERDLEDHPHNSLVETVSHGWYEDHSIEISVWCRDPNDRDNLLELLRIFMLELNHRNLSNGAPYFYNNRIFNVKFQRAYEAQDTKFIGDTVHYVGVLEYSLSSPVYGTTIEEYEKVKVSIIGEVVGYLPDNPVIIVNPDPKVPPVEGGPGSDGGIPSDTYHSPEDTYSPITVEHGSDHTLIVGSPLKTDGGALIEYIQKELEDD